MCGGSNPVQDLVSSVSDTLASMDPGPSIGSGLASLDSAVSQNVPGGWGTIGALALAVATAGASIPATEAEFIAADAANLASQGLSQEAIAQNLAASYGISATDAATVASATNAGAAETFAQTGTLNPSAATTPTATPGASSVLSAPDVTVNLAPQSSGTFGSISAPLSGSGAIPGAGAVTSTAGLTGALPAGVVVGDGTMGTVMGATYIDAGGGIPAVDFFGNPIQASSVNFGGVPTDTSGLSLSDANNARKVYNLAKGLTSSGSSALSPYTTLGSGSSGTSPLSSSNVTNIQSPKGTMVQGQQIASPLSFDIGQPTVASAPSMPAFNPAAEMSLIQNAAQGGQIVHMDTGGLLPMNELRMRGRQLGLAPTLAKAGLPMLGHATGGDIEAPHNPTFFSIGGLNSLDNTYVQGEGDGTSDSVDARLADGEFVIPADVVSKLGNGSSNAGARVLDQFLVTIREHAQKHDPKDLPPSSKGPLAYLLDAKRKVDA